MRSEEWIKKFNEDKSRIFLMVGVKQNGSYTFVADESQNPEKISQKLRELSETVRMKNSLNN